MQTVAASEQQDAATGTQAWDKGYERKAVGLLALGFGLLGLDRFILNPLFPVMSKDLGLDYQDLGLISGVLALTWGISAILSGPLCDRIGRKRVLVLSAVLFSALVAFSGLATGLISLLVIRGLMGFAEGGFAPVSIVETVRASKPTRIGLNVGLQQMAAPLVGLGFGPLIAVGLLKVLPGWEYVFGVVAIPGFVIAYLLHRTIRSSDRAGAQTVSDRESAMSGAGDTGSIRQRGPLTYRNIVFAVLAMCCFVTTLIVLSAFMPSYLSDYKGLSLDQMGLVLAVLGLGGLGGMILVPAISDRFGRKPVMIAAMFLELLAFTVFISFEASIGAGVLALCLFTISFMNSGVVAILVGPFISESVPPAVATAATGLVVGIGEIVGGAVAPALTGTAAQSLGIEIVPLITFGAAICGFLVIVFGLRENKRAAASFAMQT